MSTVCSSWGALKKAAPGGKPRLGKLLAEPVDRVLVTVIRHLQALVAGLQEHVGAFHFRVLLLGPEHHGELALEVLRGDEDRARLSELVPEAGANGARLPVAGEELDLDALQVLARKGNDVENSPERVLTVESRSRPAHDLDALHVLKDEEVERWLLGKSSLVAGVEGNAVDHEKKAAGEGVRPESTDVHGLHHGVPSNVEPRHEGHDVGDGARAGLFDHRVGDDRHRPGGFRQGDVGLGGGLDSDLALVFLEELDLSGLLRSERERRERDEKEEEDSRSHVQLLDCWLGRFHGH